MSADNYLLVSRKNFKVMSMSASSCRGFVIFTGKNFKEAEQFAFDEDVKDWYEYGVNFTDKAISNRYIDKILPEKKADMETIKDLVDGLSKALKDESEEK